MLQIQARHTLATTHYILYFQNALYRDANGVKISNTNGNYAHKAFIETEFSSGETAKNTWLVCQGYYYEDEPAKIDGTDGRADDVAARKALVATSQENYFIGKPASDILLVINTYLVVLLCEFHLEGLPMIFL